MARSLNSEEAAVFNQEILATQKFPLVNDSATELKKSDKVSELTREHGLWFAHYFPGILGF